MSKPVKDLLRKELVRRLEGVTSLAVVGFNGLDAIATNHVRGRLRDKDIRMRVVKNSIARQAFQDIGLDQAGAMLDGPCAIVYGADSVVEVVRELLDIHKENPALTVKAALLEGEVFSQDRIEELSKFPTRDEALALVVGCVLSPARKLAGCLLAPGAKLAAILKTIEENAGGEDAEAA